MSLLGANHGGDTSNAFRKPQRITITIPYGVFEALLKRSDDEGRSLSNLAATLLERSILAEQEASKALGRSDSGDGHRHLRTIN